MRQDVNKINRYSIRKLTVGAASVTVGVCLALAQTDSVEAAYLPSADLDFRETQAIEGTEDVQVGNRRRLSTNIYYETVCQGDESLAYQEQKQIDAGEHGRIERVYEYQVDAETGALSQQKRRLKNLLRLAMK